MLRDMAAHRVIAVLVAIALLAVGMQFEEIGWGAGHVFRVERASGPALVGKYRLPDGR